MKDSTLRSNEEKKTTGFSQPVVFFMPTLSCLDYGFCPTN